VRTDSSFSQPALLDYFESVKLPYVVVARLTEKIQNILRGNLQWKATDVEAWKWPR